MPTLDDAFDAVCSAWLEHFGPPPDGCDDLAPFEAMIAVLLGRGSGVERVRPVLDGLAEAGLLAPDRLAEADLVEIGDRLRESVPSLPINAIAPLKRLACWLRDHHQGRVDSLFDPHHSTGWLRGELAGIKGIGLSTADAIVLFALRRPSYPVDRASFRVLVRHGWLDPTATYDEARDLLVDAALGRADFVEDEAASALAELAHGMERLGRRYCRVAAPRCEGCPLEKLLPEGGPRELDA
jgi:endonuclease III related protein